MSSSARPTVLAVDDEPNILSALRRLLQGHGFSVRTADSGDTGLALLAEQPADVIISDMRMPRMNGAEFLCRSRQHHPEAVRILLTGYADVAATVDAVNQGEIFRYLSKPWDDRALLTTVRDGLERQQLRREREQLLATVSAQHTALQSHAEQLEQRVAQRTAELTSAQAALQLAHDRVRADLAGTLRLLSHLADGEAAGVTAGCSRDTWALVRRAAAALDMASEPAEETAHAALLEDLGRLTLEPAWRTLPLANLRSEQRQVIERLPLVAEGYLVALPSLRGAARVLHHVRERWDGKGQPDGLAADTIPLGSRVLRVCSDVVRLQAGALENRSFDRTAALRWLRYGSGTRYDPAVVACVCELLDSQTAVPSARLGLAELCVGMLVAADLVAGSVLLVPQGRRVDAALLDALRRFEQRSGLRLQVEVELNDVA
jgi:response regulator RpfG family c-di-GMP phosphodiesterase